MKKILVIGMLTFVSPLIAINSKDLIVGAASNKARTKSLKELFAWGTTVDVDIFRIEHVILNAGRF